MNENKNNIEYLPVVKSYTLYIYMDDFKVYKKYGNNVGMNSDTIIHRWLNTWVSRSQFVEQLI